MTYIDPQTTSNNGNVEKGWLVHLNGQHFDRYTSISFNRAIDNNVGQFTIEASDKNPKDTPLQANDLIEIYCGTEKVFTGYADKLTVQGSRDGSKITYAGRDILCDAVDSSVPDKGKNKKGTYTLKAACEAAFKTLGMTNKVIDTTKDKIGDKKIKQQKTEESGGCQVMQSLSKMAAKLQVWLIADENGDLLIFRAGEKTADIEFYYLFDGEGKNNILDAELAIDLSQVFSKIKVRGKGSITFDISSTKAADLVDINGSHYDDNARPTRYLEIKSNETMTKAQVEQRAKDEVNLRRAKAFEYKVQTNFFTDKKGKILHLGDMCMIEDELRQVSGKFLIRSFDVKFDRDGGTQVTLTFAPAEAFQVVELDERNEKASGKGKKKHIKKQTKRFKE
jgi:prophage tail gpP-like protein